MVQCRIACIQRLTMKKNHSLKNSPKNVCCYGGRHTQNLSNRYISARTGTDTHIQQLGHFQYNRKFKNRRRFESVSIDVSCWTDKNVRTIDDTHEQQWLKIKYETVIDFCKQR